MAHNGMYPLLSLAYIVALCASGCSAVHRHSDSGIVAHGIDSGVADAGAKPLDAAVRTDGSAGRAAADATNEPLAAGDEEDSGTRFERSLSEEVAATLKRCSIIPISEPEKIPLDVPSDFRGERASQFWPLSEACVAGGWDLARCAGQTAQVTSVHTDEVTPWGPSTRYVAHVIALSDFICCVSLDVEGAVLVGAAPAAPCGPAYTARAAMRRCNISESPSDRAQIVDAVDIPSTPSDVPLWSERAGICRDGNYDLAKCAGKRATLVSVNENTTLEGKPKRAWILSHENEVCCIWETDGAEPPKLFARECAAQ